MNGKEVPMLWVLSPRELSLLDLLADVFCQACDKSPDLDQPQYDHGFLCAYEQAQEFLLAMGKIKEGECQVESGHDPQFLLHSMGF